MQILLASTQQLILRSVGILQMIVVNYGMARIGVNLRTVELRKRLKKSTSQSFITGTM